MNDKKGKVFKTADNVCYLERKEKREENNKKLDVTILVARFLIKFEARSKGGRPQMLPFFLPLTFSLMFQSLKQKA
jgi:hypothetical protein